MTKLDLVGDTTRGHAGLVMNVTARCGRYKFDWRKRKVALQAMRAGLNRGLLDWLL